MPLFWRYLLGQYVKVLILCTLSFIALLLTSRLEEIAHIATYGADIKLVLLFACYQIPAILPIALPISSLISSVLLFQRLSQTYELTAFRALGISIRSILSPLLLVATLLGLMNFYISSEIATTAHLQTRKMAYELTSINPLLLLQNSKIAKLKGAYVQLDPEKQGHSAKNLLIAIHNHKTNRLNLLLSKKLETKNDDLIGKNVTLISSLPNSFGDQCDHLVIENQKEAKSKAPEFASLLSRKSLKIAGDHLKFGLLRAKIHSLKKEGATFFEKNVQKCYSEIMRRFSLGLAPLTFTLLGGAFGIQISRGGTKKGLFAALLLSSFSLICFFIAKGVDDLFLIASLLFLLPHALIVYFSNSMLRRVNAGRER